MTLFSSGVIRLNSFESVFPGFELVFLLLVLCLECIKLALSIVCVCLHSDGSVVLSVCLLLPQIRGHLLRRALQPGHGVILLILVEIEFVTGILAVIIEVCFLWHSGQHALIFPFLHLLQLLLLDQLVLLKALSLCVCLLGFKLLEIVLNYIVPLVFVDIELQGRVLIHQLSFVRWLWNSRNLWAAHCRFLHIVWVYGLTSLGSIGSSAKRPCIGTWSSCWTRSPSCFSCRFQSTSGFFYITCCRSQPFDFVRQLLVEESEASLWCWAAALKQGLYFIDDQSVNFLFRRGDNWELVTEFINEQDGELLPLPLFDLFTRLGRCEFLGWAVHFYGG